MRQFAPSAAVAFAVGALFASSSALAADWTAVLSVDDGTGPQSVRIVAATEDECYAQVSLYRGAVIVEPCQPTASAITDPNDANRTSKTPKPVTEPRDAGGVLGGVGHTGGG